MNNQNKKMSKKYISPIEITRTREEQFNEFDEQRKIVQEEIKEPIQLTGNVKKPVGSYLKKYQPEDRTFWQDTVDEFWINWVGQSIENNYIYDSSYSREIDLNFNPYQNNYLEGYEDYEDQFLNARNQEEADNIKARIDRNLYRKERLSRSDRVMGPALVGNLLNPENFVPLGLFGAGVKFGSRFYKGGAISSLSVGATEPIRRHFDPTATDDETIMYVGSSFLFGGLFNGFLGRRGLEKSIKKEIVDDKGGENGIINNIAKGTKETNGEKIFDGELINIQKEYPDIKIIRVQEGETKTFQDMNGKHIPESDAINISKKNTNWIEKPVTKKINIDRTTDVYSVQGLPRKAPIRIVQDGDETKAIVNTEYIQRMFDSKKHIAGNLDSQTPATMPKEIADKFKNSDQLTEFYIKKEINRETAFRDRNTGESVAEYEQALNYDTYNKALKNKTGDYRTDYGDVPVLSFMLKQIDKFYDQGKVSNALRGIDDESANTLAKAMLEINGDSSIVTRAQKEGIVLNSSVHTRTMNRWGKTLDEFQKEFDDAFVSFAKGDDNRLLGTVGNIDLESARLKLGYNLKGIVDPSQEPVHIYSEFSRKVFQAISDQDIYKSLTDKNIIKAVDISRKFFDKFEKEATRLGMFVSQRNLGNKIDFYDGIIKQLDKNIKSKNFTPEAKARFEELKTRTNAQLGKAKSQKQDMDDGLINPLTDEFKQTYVARYYSFDKISKNLEGFKTKIRTHITNNAGLYAGRLQKRNGNVDELVDDITENILQQSARNDADGLMAFGRTGGAYKSGARPLMERSLRIESKEIEEFLETDLTQITRMYANRMGMAIEMQRSFGDRHLDDFLIKTELEILSKGNIKTKKQITAMNKGLGAINGAKEKMYGTYNNKDITAIDKVLGQFARNLTSFNTMGKVLYTAYADAGRPIMVNGMSRAFPEFFGTMINNKQAYIKMAKDHDFLYHAHELANNMGAMERYTTGIGPVGSNLLQRSQGAWYWANGLTPWTLLMKRWTGIISQKRFIEDIVKVSNGTATKDEIFRLNSYNISIDDAKLIAKMPWQKEKTGLILANTKAWGSKKYGNHAIQKFRAAVQMDIERTIITPSPADKINMMFGVVDIPSESFRKIVAGNELLQKFGFQEHAYGVKFQNAFMSLPFQFMSWMVASNRKLLMAGVTGRDFYLMQGAMAMIAFGAYGDYLKAPEMWFRKSHQEKFLSGVERSGVLGIFSDVPGMIENATDNQYGLRPMLGMPDPFDPDNNRARPHDKYRVLMGPAGSKFYDLYDAMTSDELGPRDTKKAVRDLLPTQNLLWWDDKFKSIYNWSTDY